MSGGVQDFHFVSAADGTNVVRVFGDLIRLGAEYKKNSTDIDDEIASLLEDVCCLSHHPLLLKCTAAHITCCFLKMRT